MIKQQFTTLFVVLVLCYWVVSSYEHPLPPTNLKVEYLTNPLGVDVERPRFFWWIQHESSGHVQSAYQIQVNEAWDSGKVDSRQTSQVVYSGDKKLVSDTTYTWRVRWWDSEGSVSEWSQLAMFHMGIQNDEWKGKWITGDLIRKNFTVTDKVKRAHVYMSGIGYSVLSVNGQRVGKDVLNPTWTTYTVRTLYSTYDITSLLVPGENVIGIELGRGWWGNTREGSKTKRVIAQAHLETDQQKVMIIPTDETWMTSSGPIVYDDIYNGETYDARLEKPGWNNKGYKDSDWKAASTIDAPGGVLSSQLMQPVRVNTYLKAQKISQPKTGMFVYDFGQNFAGWVRLRVSGPAGTEVTMRFAEVLNADGTIDVRNLRTAKATDKYTLKGTGSVEEYEPSFTYHGFRYVELTGFPGAPELDTLQGRHVYSSIETVGTFKSSEPILNKIQSLIWWGQTSNLMGYPTDCPQRDERYGWLADADIVREEAIFNFDMAPLLSNFVRNMNDNQLDPRSGQKNVTISDTVPDSLYAGYPADPAWGTAYVDIAHEVWRYYGDVTLVKKFYPDMKNWVNFLVDSAKGSGLKSFYTKFGDWVPPPPFQRASGNLVSSFFLVLNLVEMSEMAQALQNQDDYNTWINLAKQFGKEFHTTFYNETAGYYDTGLQTAQVLPLALQKFIIPDDQTKLKVLQYLVNDVVVTQNYHLTTGIWGTKYLMDVLSEFGRTDIALKLALQTTYPSWGYMIVNEHEQATTLWELWNSWEGDPSMNSRNHIMFGSVGAWFYKYLAGISPLEPGFSTFQIKPAVELLDSLSVEYSSIKGRVSVQWNKNADATKHLSVEVPTGTMAHLILPKNLSANFQWKDKSFVTQVDNSDYIEFILGSGDHHVKL